MNVVIAIVAYAGAFLVGLPTYLYNAREEVDGVPDCADRGIHGGSRLMVRFYWAISITFLVCSFTSCRAYRSPRRS